MHLLLRQSEKDPDNIYLEVLSQPCPAHIMAGFHAGQLALQGYQKATLEGGFARLSEFLDYLASYESQMYVRESSISVQWKN